MPLTTIIAGFFAGLLGSLGLGGGGVLVMFLTVFLGFSQLKAQGINLLFFIPIAVFALFWHIRHKLISWKLALPAILLGLLGAFLGAYTAEFIGSSTAKNIFGVFLIIIGGYELLGVSSAKKK
jgi:uncharacterized membrane protein YfcA